MSNARVGHDKKRSGSVTEPGEIVKCLFKTKTMDPVIVLEKAFEANYSAKKALVKAFDPQQNHRFLDQFIEVPIDLSKVLFILTNDDGFYSYLLQDFITVIPFKGYLRREKLLIAKTYIMPQVLNRLGLKSDDFRISDDVIYALIDDYSFERGLDGLEHKLEKIYKKLAYRLVSGDKSPIEVTVSDLPELLRRPPRVQDKLYDKTPVGVAVGLTVNYAGGGMAYIETRLARPLTDADIKDKKKKGSIKFTGLPGMLKKETIQLAYSYAQLYLHEKQPDNHILNKGHIHMHFPRAFVRKNGPSAGAVTVTALLSLALNEPVRPDTVMTGEISLTGKILAIGGLESKLMAAKKVGAKLCLIPEENMRDLFDIADDLKEGIEIRPVSHYDEVFPIMFPGIEEKLRKHREEVEQKKKKEKEADDEKKKKKALETNGKGDNGSSSAKAKGTDDDRKGNTTKS